MARMRGNTVILKGDPLQDTSRVRRYVDATDGDPAVQPANKTNIYPGMLISYDGSIVAKAPLADAVGHYPGDVPHSVSAGVWTGSVADFRDYVGDGLSIPYTDGDTMQVFYPYSGCVLRGLFASPNAETTLKKDAALVSDGMGGLKLAEAVVTRSDTLAHLKADVDKTISNLNVVGYVFEAVTIDANAFDLKATKGAGTENFVYIQWRVK